MLMPLADMKLPELLQSLFCNQGPKTAALPSGRKSISPPLHPQYPNSPHKPLRLRRSNDNIQGFVLNSSAKRSATQYSSFCRRRTTGWMPSPNRLVSRRNQSLGPSWLLLAIVLVMLGFFSQNGYTFGQHAWSLRESNLTSPAIWLDYKFRTDRR